MDIIKTKRPPHQTSISLPLDMAKYLDHIRDPDIPRSRFFVRLIERALELEIKESKTEVVGALDKTTHNLQDVACVPKTIAFMEWKGQPFGVDKHHG